MFARIALAVALGLTTLTAIAADKKTEIKSDEQKAGYAMGFQFGINLKKKGLEVPPDAFALGIEDALTTTQPRLPVEELQQALVTYQQKLVEEKKKQAAANSEKGDKYRAQNKKKSGVVELPSGLQYVVVTKGNGPKPKESDTVVVHYQGTLIDGKVFDSSIQRGTPATFQLQQIIPGWKEALILMPTGSKWKVVIPPHLAYGPNGVGNSIGPNETLLFDIELMEIKKADAAAPAPAK